MLAEQLPLPSFPPLVPQVCPARVRHVRPAADGKPTPGRQRCVCGLPARAAKVHGLQGVLVAVVDVAPRAPAIVTIPEEAWLIDGGGAVFDEAETDARRRWEAWRRAIVVAAVDRRAKAVADAMGIEVGPPKPRPNRRSKAQAMHAAAGELMRGKPRKKGKDGAKA